MPTDVSRKCENHWVKLANSVYTDYKFKEWSTNRSRTLFASLFGVGATILLAIVLIVSANRFQSTSSTEGVSAASTGYPVPTDEPYPVGTTSGVRAVEPNNNTPTPFPSPIPTTGVGYSASAAERIVLSDSAIEKVFSGYELSGDYLFLVTLLNNGNRALQKVDVTTGSTERLVEIPSSSGVGFEDIRADGQNVIWSGYSDNGNERRLYHLNLSNNQYAEIQTGSFSYASVKGDSVLWVDSLNNIVRYDLRSSQSEIVLQQEGHIATSSPVACSENEIAFLDNFHRPSASSYVSHVSADLVLYTINTGQRTTIGRVTHAPNGSIERNRTFDCDTERLVWVADNVDSGDLNRVTSAPELHIFNFNSRSSSRINALTGDLEPFAGSVFLDGDIVISRVGYDLGEDVVFSPYIEPNQRKGVQLANSRLVWSEVGEDANAIYVIQLAVGGN